MIGYSETVAWIEGLVAKSPLLQATKYELYTERGQLWVKVQGANYEAHAWHVAVGGLQMPSWFDSHGVRRSEILGVRVHVLVIDDPKAREVR